MAKDKRTDTVRAARSEVVKYARALSAAVVNNDDETATEVNNSLMFALATLDTRLTASKEKVEA